MSNLYAYAPKAQRHLARRDARLRKLIQAIGPCTLRQEPDRCASLGRAIIAQQISTKAAAAILSRLEQALAVSGMTPSGILSLPPSVPRQVGRSTARARALIHLAPKVYHRTAPVDNLHE